MKSRTILYATAALIILVVLMIVLRGRNAPTVPQTSSVQAKSYSFVLNNKQLSSGPDKMTVTDGDHVKITLTSSQDWPELHLHGYEIAKQIKKDTPTVIDFTADKTGSFDLEVHFVDEAASGSGNTSGAGTAGNELQISHLEVLPK